MSQSPVNVSPLIKLGRWSMLAAGIFYGVGNHKRLSAKEALNREKQAIIKAERDLVLAEEKKKAREDEMHALAILSKPGGKGH